jgi:hypothetical protein
MPSWFAAVTMAAARGSGSIVRMVKRCRGATDAKLGGGSARAW